MMKIDAIRKDFPMFKNKSKKGYDLIYFDNAATTFKPMKVIEAVNEYYTKYSVNAHRGDYELSYKVDTLYESVRDTVASFINCDRKEVVFVSGTSAALNQIAFGFGQNQLKPGDVVLSDEAEHASNYLPWQHACETTGATLEFIELDEHGYVTIETFKKAIHSGVKIVSIAHVTNVLGCVLDIKEISRIAHEHGAVVVVDGAQSTPHMPVDVRDLDCDFFAFSAHKLCGPTGTGVLYGKYELLEAMEPLMLGGGSNARYDMCGNLLMKDPPYKFESGTPAIEATLGMKAAIEYIQEIGLEKIHEYESELRAYMLKRMKELDNVIIYNEDSDSGIITFNIKNVFSQDAATYFSDKGISLRSGQHCAKLLMNFLDTPSTLRASLYFYNTKEEIDYFIDVCSQINPDSFLDVFF
ncbi:MULTISPECIES: cysteine desulfurase [unclassified Breznakia]|uniref:aminotransferase class V-fold PLP-dependent enzyme n=1 Tax=unclassified Breznakia TaxID=2623764 RepID=UPI002404E327|nr:MULTISPECIES: cysteine desulfurase [unclassified Breznakia]